MEFKVLIISVRSKHTINIFRKKPTFFKELRGSWLLRMIVTITIDVYYSVFSNA